MQLRYLIVLATALAILLVGACGPPTTSTSWATWAPPTTDQACAAKRWPADLRRGKRRDRRCPSGGAALRPLRQHHARRPGVPRRQVRFYRIRLGYVAWSSPTGRGWISPLVLLIFRLLPGQCRCCCSAPSRPDRGVALGDPGSGVLAELPVSWPALDPRRDGLRLHPGRHPAGAEAQPVGLPLCGGAAPPCAPTSRCSRPC